jgi:hypothetical protein
MRETNTTVAEKAEVLSDSDIYQAMEEMSGYVDITLEDFRNTDLCDSGLSGIIFLLTKRDSRQAGMTRNETIQLSYRYLFCFSVKI